MERITVNRSQAHGEFQLSQIFHGLENVQAVQSIFGGREAAAEVLRSIRIRLDDSAEYMYVDDASGVIIVSGKYLQSASESFLYLDIIHELVHVRQYREGQDLFDSKFKYVERPTELEAYKVTLGEARRIGMTEEEIEDYLYVEWISRKEHKKLAETLGVNGLRRRRERQTT